MSLETSGKDAVRELRAINDRVAIEVMGWRSARSPLQSRSNPEETAWCRSGRGWDTVDKEAWRPTRDIAHAWLVVEAMRERGWRIVLENEVAPEAPYLCGFHHLTRSWDAEGHWFATAPTAPEAICRAALKAAPHTPTNSKSVSVGGASEGREASNG